MILPAVDGLPVSGGLPCAPSEVDSFLAEPTPEVSSVIAALPGPILVLGAGGKMGLHLSLMLHRVRRRAGTSDVVAVSRFQSHRSREEFVRHGVPVLACDLSDDAALAALPDAPTIFYLAGMKFGTSEKPELLQAANVEMPAKVANRFAGSRIVAFSTGCVYPLVRVDSGGASERTPVGPVGDYAASCVAREQAFTRASLAHGTRSTLVRLNYSVEFRYGVLVDIGQKVLAGLPVDVTTGHFNAIWQRDAVAQAIHSVSIASSPPRAINITGPETLSVRETARRFGEIFGRSPLIVGKEADTALLSNAGESHRLFGLPATRSDQMIAWVAAWLLQNGETWGKPTGFEKRDGRY